VTAGSKINYNLAEIFPTESGPTKF
jgi:hypothetical protein